MILPKVWPDDGKRPVCVHLAGTGDHVCLLLFEYCYFMTTVQPRCHLLSPPWVSVLLFRIRALAKYLCIPNRTKKYAFSKYQTS